MSELPKTHLERALYMIGRKGPKMNEWIQEASRLGADSDQIKEAMGE